MCVCISICVWSLVCVCMFVHEYVYVLRSCGRQRTTLGTGLFPTTVEVLGLNSGHYVEKLGT